MKIVPERYAKGYLDWLGEKRDWPISRQLVVGTSDSGVDHDRSKAIEATSECRHEHDCELELTDSWRIAVAIHDRRRCIRIR